MPGGAEIAQVDFQRFNAEVMVLGNTFISVTP